MDKCDARSGKICRNCVHLAKTLHCFDKQMALAEQKLNDERTDEFCSDVSKKLHADGFSERETAMAAVEKFSSKEDYTKDDDLDYDIEWMSEEERKKVTEAFGRKRAATIARKNALWEANMQNFAQIEEFLPIPGDIESKVIKTEISPGNEYNEYDTKESDAEIVAKADNNICKKEFIKSEQFVIVAQPQGEFQDEENCKVTNEKKEFIKSEHFVAVAQPQGKFQDEENCKVTNEKKEFIKSEQFVIVAQTQGKSQDEQNCSVTKENKDSEIILIEDSDDEDSPAPRPPPRRKPLTSISKNSSGVVVGNHDRTPMKPPRGNSRINENRDPAKLGGKRASLGREAAGGRKTSAANIATRRFFQCTLCNVDLYSVAEVLHHHNQTHTPKRAALSCRMCDTTFIAKADLFAHFNQHVESHLFRCHLCPNEFVLKKNLTEHMKCHMKREATDGDEEPIINSPGKRCKIEAENSAEAENRVPDDSSIPESSKPPAADVAVKPADHGREDTEGAETSIKPNPEDFGIRRNTDTDLAK